MTKSCLFFTGKESKKDGEQSGAESENSGQSSGGEQLSSEAGTGNEGKFPGLV